jgi:hypothetical protein
LKYLSSISRSLAAKGVSFWGEQNDSPNAVLDWEMACQYFNGTNITSHMDTFTFTGDSVPEEVEASFTQSVGSASLHAVAVKLFKNANGQPPSFFVSANAPTPDLVKVVPRGVDFMAAAGGARSPAKTECI